MRDLSQIVLKPDDFEAMAQMCRLDMRFPADFQEWSALINAAGQQASEMAVHNEPLELEPYAFKAWCAKVGIVPSVDALRAYAIVRRQQDRAWTAGF
ncbi:MAG TPA: hypothetical protein VIN06_03935 [Devosia sp.]